MITVLDGGGIGYGATCDLSESGLRRAASDAHDWARRSAGRTVIDFSKIAMPKPQAEWATPVQIPWDIGAAGREDRAAARAVRATQDRSSHRRLVERALSRGDREPLPDRRRRPRPPALQLPRADPVGHGQRGIGDDHPHARRARLLPPGRHGGRSTRSASARPRPRSPPRRWPCSPPRTAPAGRWICSSPPTR